MSQKMETVGQLASLLYKIKCDEFGTKKHKITAKQLRYFSRPQVAKRYKTFQIRKKSGGMREINAPCYQLKVILYFLNMLLKAIYTPNESAMGFAEGRSVVTNAQHHIGHHYVFNIDLENFFPSIPQARIWKRLQLPPFNFTQEIANVIAGLCCHPNAEGTMNVLPQGAATSPLLTNAICEKLDRRMRGVAKRFGLHYSRYADDMTFSSMHNVYQEGSEFRHEIKRLIEEQGFRMNDKKTRLLRDGQRQEVTGLTVNSTVNVSRKYIKYLRWILHIWETEGYAKAYSKFYPRYKHDKGYIKKGEPVMENVIGGKLNYLLMVKGANNTACNKLLQRFNRLQQVLFVDQETDKGESYIYVQPYTMKEFCEYFNTSIRLEVSERKNLVGKCVLYGRDKTIAISKATQKKLCPKLENKKPGEPVESELIKKCHVTLCRAKGKNFWLITEFKPQRSRCLSIQNANVDIDQLLEIWEQEGYEEASLYFMSVVNGNDSRVTLEELFGDEKTAKKSVKPSPKLNTKIDAIPVSDIEQLLSDVDIIEQSEIDIENLPKDIDESDGPIMIF